MIIKDYIIIIWYRKNDFVWFVGIYLLFNFKHIFFHRCIHFFFRYLFAVARLERNGLLLLLLLLYDAASIRRRVWTRKGGSSWRGFSVAMGEGAGGSARGGGSSFCISSEGGRTRWRRRARQPLQRTNWKPLSVLI